MERGWRAVCTAGEVRATALAASLRAKRSNPDCLRGKILDCFVARAPRNDEFGTGTYRPLICRSPDGAQCNPGPSRHRRTFPDFAALHPGYELNTPAPSPAARCGSSHRRTAPRTRVRAS
ncbi:hypothetical protein FXB40_38195 [Bradyrhizobium rifense]|uniref:Uncharacterized protein n=1 Tax=Bradyrhizobium rifense TaxID=515499 RepID=A0A5D3K2A6_9BRAD|nr:hypothetical protein FXB40_38195 [Bradyrhizobium rifense]